MDDNSAAIRKIKTRRIFYLAFGAVTYLFIGLMYAFSIFAQPIGETYPEYAPYLSQVFQLSMFTNTLAALLGAQVYKRVSPRAAMLVANLLFGVGFTATALCSSWGLWTLFLFYSLLAGSGIGIAYNAIISLVNSWFPDKTGLSSGVMLMGVGLSPLLLGNSANAAFAVADWRAVFLAVAVVWVAFMIVLVLVIPPAPPDIAARLGMAGGAAAAAESPTKNQHILKTRTFWLFCLWSTPCIACGLVLIGSALQGAASLGMDLGFAALLVGLMGVMNAVGRLATGVLTDRFGVVFTMTLSAALILIAMTCMALAFGLGGGEASRALYVVGAIVAGYPYGSAPVINAAYARHRHAAVNYSTSLGFLNCNITAAALVNMVVLAAFGAPGAANGATVYSVLVGFAVITLASVMAFKRLYRRDLARISEELQ